MNQVLLDYSILSMLANPAIKASDKERNPFLAYMNRDFKMQAVCFDFQIQALNLTSYKRRAMEEETILNSFKSIMNSETGALNDNEKMILSRQQSIVDRFNIKSERISHLFAKELSGFISNDFLLPGYVVPLCYKHFIDEEDLRQFNIEVIPLDKTDLKRCMKYIDKWKERNKDYPISDMRLLDLITRMLCNLIKLDEWFIIDSTERLNDVNVIFLDSDFKELLKDIEIHPTLIKK